MESNHTMTAQDLKAEFGRCISDRELAKYLGLDTRTLRKYASNLGGVMVTPGKHWFFENIIREIIKNAELNHEKGCAPVSSKHSHTRGTWKKETEALSGRHQKIVQKSSVVGKRNKETTDGGKGSRSRHGIF